MNNQPVCKIDEGGSKFWTLNGDLHREDGPAVEFEDGDKDWWLHGKRHREDGPAVEASWGLKEWWLDGEMVKPEDVVDYNLAKGVFCYYDKETQQLIFGGDNE